MRDMCIAVCAIGLVAVSAYSALAQPEGRSGKLSGWNEVVPRVNLLPQHVYDELELTDDQVRQLYDLEEEAQKTLLKILTDDQKQKLRNVPLLPPSHRAPLRNFQYDRMLPVKPQVKQRNTAPRTTHGLFRSPD